MYPFTDDHLRRGEHEKRRKAAAQISQPKDRVREHEIERAKSKHRHDIRAVDDERIPSHGQHGRNGVERKHDVGRFDDDKRDKSEQGLDRILKVDELRQLSLRDLRLLRNTIYARHGRPFKSQILQDHFSGMSWYKIDAAYADKLLSANDTRNIALIKSVENEFGGPLSDEDWLTEPATDGA